MQWMRDIFRAINHFQHRNGKRRKIKKGGGVGMNKRVNFKKGNCVECKGYKEPYYKYYCEKCYRKILVAKLEADQ